MRSIPVDCCLASPASRGVPTRSWARAPTEELALEEVRAPSRTLPHGWQSQPRRTGGACSCGGARAGRTSPRLLGRDRDPARAPARGGGRARPREPARRTWSPKFLRLALEKLGGERGRVPADQFLRAEKRLQLLEEILPPSVVGRFDAIASTNAVHLYYDLGDTLRSWLGALRPGGRAFVQSGNILNPDAPPALDHRRHRRADRSGRPRAGPRAATPTGRSAPRSTTRADGGVRGAAREVLPAGAAAGLLPRRAARAPASRSPRWRAGRSRPRSTDWYEFLAAYHEGVLGWAGGSRRVDGADPTDEVDRAAAAADARGARPHLRRPAELPGQLDVHHRSALTRNAFLGTAVTAVGQRWSTATRASPSSMSASA